MGVGLLGQIGRNAVRNVVRDFKGETDGVTIPLRDGEDPCVKDPMLRGQNAQQPLVLVSTIAICINHFVKVYRLSPIVAFRVVTLTKLLHEDRNHLPKNTPLMIRKGTWVRLF